MDLSASVPSTSSQTSKPVDFFGFDDLSKTSNAIPNPAMLSSNVPRSTSGSSLAYSASSGTGTSSPMGMGRPMGGMGMAPQQAGMGMAPPQGGAMGMQRGGGGGNMTFDPFANMTPSTQQQQQQYRQGGRR